MNFAHSGLNENMTENHSTKNACNTSGKIKCYSEHELNEKTRHIIENQTHSLLSFIRMKLHQFNLNERYQELEILNEAYSRTSFKFRSSREFFISNLYGWYKTTSFNIIREYSRAEIRERELRKKVTRQANKGILDLQYEDSEYNLEAIKKMVNNDLEFKILKLRVIDELSWESVCRQLIKDGSFKCELSQQFIARIRQRHSRVLRRINQYIE